MKSLVVMNRVHPLVAVNGTELIQSDKWIEAGTKVHVGRKTTKVYKKKEISVIPFAKKGVMYYIIEDDLHPLEGK